MYTYKYIHTYQGHICMLIYIHTHQNEAQFMHKHAQKYACMDTRMYLCMTHVQNFVFLNPSFAGSVQIHVSTHV